MIESVAFAPAAAPGRVEGGDGAAQIPFTRTAARAAPASPSVGVTG